MQRLHILTVAVVFQTGYLFGQAWQPDRRSWPVTIEEASFSVAFIIVSNNKVHWKCGGAIITNLYALTTASCLYDVPNVVIDSNYVRMRSNTTNIDPGFHPFSDHTIGQIIIHELYVGSLNGYDNNIALAWTPHTFKAEYEKPINIDKELLPFNRPDFAIVYSWHKLVLHATNVTLRKFNDCRKMYQWVGIFVTHRMVCGYVNDGENFCNEMEGSPLIWDGFLLGLASYAHECSTYNFPATFTRIDVLRKWIAKYTKLP